MLTEFISPSDQRWRESLRTVRHDIYDRPEYVAICAKYEKATPTAFYASEGTNFCLIPLLRRTLPAQLGAPASWSDAVSPYGYSSALFSGDAGWALRAVSALIRACAESGIISVFIRVHPLLATPVGVLESAGIRVLHGSTVYVDLTLPAEELNAQLRKCHRVEIRRLRDRNFKVIIDDWSLLEEFMQIYWAGMQRLDADQYYFFPADYFYDLRSSLGPLLHLLSVIGPDSSVAAAALFTETDGIVQYHLSGTAQAYRHCAPSKLMIEHAITWAKSAGNRILHLGGGVGSRNDGLYEFKAGFSSLRSPFYTWRLISDPERYSTLADAAGASGTPADEFFPAYRRVGIGDLSLTK